MLIKTSFEQKNVFQFNLEEGKMRRRFRSERRRNNATNLILSLYLKGKTRDAKQYINSLEEKLNKAINSAERKL